MTGNDAVGFEAVASFVVEREAGTGYRVTAADGDRSDERKTRALKLLDDLGQPDPRGPREFFRWIGPTAGTREYVFIAITLMPNGEARYHQGWFRLLTLPHHSRGWLRAFVSVVVAGLATAILAGWMLFSPDRPRWFDSVRGALVNGERPGGLGPALPSPEPVSDPGMAQLLPELRASRDVRNKVRDYLMQDGFAAASPEVSLVQRSVKLTSDLDKPPPQHESIQLNNVEVAEVLQILRILDDILERATTPPVEPGKS